MENATTLFWFITVLILSFFVALKIQAFLLRRAISQVIGRFQETHTLCSEGSKTAEELRLTPPTLWERFFKPRDFKPYALKLLTQAGTVRLNDDEKMCLLEKEIERVQQTFGI